MYISGTPGHIRVRERWECRQILLPTLYEGERSLYLPPSPTFMLLVLTGFLRDPRIRFVDLVLDRPWSKGGWDHRRRGPFSFDSEGYPGFQRPVTTIGWTGVTVPTDECERDILPPYHPCFRTGILSLCVVSGRRREVSYHQCLSLKFEEGKNGYGQDVRKRNKGLSQIRNWI